eukprot:COSAG02_NODE_67416_length_253_cov_0.655844_1_plen_51_part_10
MLIFGAESPLSLVPTESTAGAALSASTRSRSADATYQKPYHLYLAVSCCAV